MKYGSCLESSGLFLESLENFSGPKSQLSNCNPQKVSGILRPRFLVTSVGKLVKSHVIKKSVGTLVSMGIIPWQHHGKACQKTNVDRSDHILPILLLTDVFSLFFAQTRRFSFGEETEAMAWVLRHVGILRSKQGLWGNLFASVIFTLNSSYRKYSWK